MKNVIIGLSVLASTSLSAQSFVAGWDFDGVSQGASSIFANWGDQSGSAVASWTHSPANPPIVFTSEFSISAANNSAVINDSFGFLAGGVDSNTGFDQFSDNVSGGEFGFQSLSGDDVFSLSFDGAGWENLQLTYAFAPSQGGEFTAQSFDLSAFDGDAFAQFDFTTVANGVYDNFAITGDFSGAVIPEPSTYALMMAGVMGALVYFRRRK